MDDNYEAEYSRSDYSYRSHGHQPLLSNLTYTEIVNATSSTVPYSFELIEDVSSIHSADHTRDVAQVDELNDDSDSESYKIQRRNSVPNNPLTEIEVYKEKKEFYYLKKAAEANTRLMADSNNKYDLDSQEGLKHCRKFLSYIEKIINYMQIPVMSRKYRASFTQAYKILYKEGSLCYLTEILDSAQESFPYLWVNGEKYDFSENVIRSGAALFHSFCKLKQEIKRAYTKVENEPITVDIIALKSEIGEVLQDFDATWVQFEQSYVMELMMIESEARKLVVKAIKLEEEISEYEEKEKAKGRVIIDGEEYNQLREKLVKVMGKVNSVANTEGKGRDDLSSEVLAAAERACRKISSCQSMAVRGLAKAIRNSFKNFRELMRKYEGNIEAVDPQLKNNPDLVSVLMKFESSWEKGKEYFMQDSTLDDLIIFSQLIEGITEKYPVVQSQVDAMDANIFITLPRILVLKCVDTKSFSALTYFNPILEYSEGDKLEKLTQLYQLMLRVCPEYELYNCLEERLLELSSKGKCGQEDTELIMGQFVQLVKVVSVGIQRFNPTEWNNFLMTSLGQVF